MRPIDASLEPTRQVARFHAGEEEKYTLVLANPPFAGSLDYENTAKDLLQIVKTKKTELLFLALFLKLLKPGVEADVAKARDLASAEGCGGFEFEADETGRERLWEARHEAAFAVREIAPEKRPFTTDSCDSRSLVGSNCLRSVSVATAKSSMNCRMNLPVLYWFVRAIVAEPATPPVWNVRIVN